MSERDGFIRTFAIALRYWPGHSSYLAKDGFRSTLKIDLR